MQKSNAEYPVESILLFSAYILLIVITIFHNQPPLFDEILFMNNVNLMQNVGFSRDFLLNIEDQAPGPLYQFIHITLEPVTKLKTPAIRLVNVAFLIFIVILTGELLKVIFNPDRKNSFNYALWMIAIPMVWQIAGLALTEMPAMFFALASVFSLINTLKNVKNLFLCVIFGILSGLLLGISITGRSVFLMIIPAAFILLDFSKVNSSKNLIIFIFCIVALSISIPIFSIWGGLVPPKQSHVGQGVINPWNGILAFAYCCLAAILIAPCWLAPIHKMKWKLIMTYSILLILNTFFFKFKYYPLSEALSKVFSANFMTEYYPIIIAPALAALAFYFIYSSAIKFKNNNNIYFRFILLISLFLLSTSFKVTHLFSTRYVAQVAPFFLISFYGYNTKKASIIRIIAGVTIGILSLETYFKFA